MGGYTLNPEYFKEGKPDFIAMAKRLSSYEGPYYLLVIGRSYKECDRLRATLPEGFGNDFLGNIEFIYPDGGKQSGWSAVQNKKVLGCVITKKLLTEGQQWPELNLRDLIHSMYDAMTWLDIDNHIHLWMYA